MGPGKTYQLRSRGINLSDFYVNSIHFIYSTKSYVVEGEGHGGWANLGRIAFIVIASQHIFNVVFAQILGKINL